MKVATPTTPARKTPRRLSETEFPPASEFCIAHLIKSFQMCLIIACCNRRMGVFDPDLVMAWDACADRGPFLAAMHAMREAS